MKKLLFILAICLISTPAIAWEKFDGKITDTVVLEYIVDDPHVEDILATLNDPTELEALRVEMGLEAVAAYVESIPGIHVFESGYLDPIGILVGFDGPSIMIYLPEIESIFTIDSRTGSAQTAYIYYEADDCTGKPYVHASTQYSITETCGTLYTGKRKQPKFFTSGSRLRINENRCSCFVNSRESFYTPAVEVSARTVGLYLPIALPLRFQAWVMPTE